MSRDKYFASTNNDIQNVDTNEISSKGMFNKDTRTGIRVIARHIQVIQPTLNMNTSLQHGKPSQIKSTASTNKKIGHQYSSKAIRGLQVVSSRQSSNEKPMIVSRSNSEQKVKVQQVKSQTFISQFQSVVQNNKQPESSRERSKVFDNIEKVYKQKLGEFIQRQTNAYSQQMNKLKSIIKENEKRIDNLIYTLNVLMETAEKKGRNIQKVQCRLDSLTRYSEQSYQFCIARINDVQIVQDVLKNALQQMNNKTIQAQNQCFYIDSITNNVFLLQQQNNHNQQRFINRQFNVYESRLNEWEGKVDNLMKSSQGIVFIKSRITMFQNEMKALKDIMKQKSERQNPNNNSRFDWIGLSKEQMSIKLQCLQLKVNRLEEIKEQLQSNYRHTEQQSKSAIWQLSNLLNLKEKEIITMKQQIRAKETRLQQKQSLLREQQKQSESLSKYNRELENKLIQHKYKESSLRLDMSNQMRYLEQSSRLEEQDRLQKENQVFRQRYEQLFRHNQFLQDLNCKNNLAIINNQKTIHELYEQIADKQKAINNQHTQLRDIQMEISQLNNKDQLLSREKEKYGILLNILKSKEVEIAQLMDRLDKLSEDYNQVIVSGKNVQEQLQEEYAYTNHLESQVQKLNQTLSQYTSSFTLQSQVFKDTIQTLKRQNKDLRQSSQQYKRQEINHTKRQIKGVDRMKNRSFQSQKLGRLRNAFIKRGYALPVVCQIDGTGYLKHYENSTYIIDQQENLFDLEAGEIEQGLRSGLFRLFQ